MRALFGVVSMLVVLVVVGLLATKQLKTPAALVPGVAASGVGAAISPQSAAQLQEQVRADVVKALEQGARKEEPTH